MAEWFLLSLSVGGCFLFTMTVLAAAAAHALGVAVGRGIERGVSTVLLAARVLQNRLRVSKNGGFTGARILSGEA